MKIAITSGKGGVGKSLLATAISLQISKLGYKTLLFDADSEGPNDHLFLEIKLKKVKNVYKFVPVIDKRKCKKCGICAEICKANAIFFSPGNYPRVIRSNCIGCGACKLLCPFGAIKDGKEKIGEILEGKLNRLRLITAKSKIGIEETSLVIKEGKKIVENIDANFAITDTPAGTHCSTIHALLRNEIAIIVVEPTKFGIHDFLKILKLVKLLKMKSFVVINKVTRRKSRNKIYEICKKRKVKILGEISFRDELLSPNREVIQKIDEIVEIVEKLIKL